VSDRHEIFLREASPPVRLTLSDNVAAELVRLKIATVSPHADGTWLVSGVSRVGVAHVAGSIVRIAPKVPLARLFFLLSRTPDWDGWHNDDVIVDRADELYPAIAELFCRATERILRGGVLRAYREERAAEPAIRGRWLVSEQIKKRTGMPIPAELSFDEYTSDITENRLLRSAARQLLRVPNLAGPLRVRLHRIDHQLDDVTTLTRGGVTPTIRFDRRNNRYRPGIALAKLIINGSSLDHGAASSDTPASGFLLNMSTIFERFVEAEVVSAAKRFGGVVRAQHRTHLDTGRNIAIKPDLVWLHEGAVRAVFDAKYKSEKPAGYPNADIYQMLAYCIHHGVPTGHLIYAAGNDHPARYEVSEANVTIFCHAIALDRSEQEIADQIDNIVASAIGASAHKSAPPLGSALQ